MTFVFNSTVIGDVFLALSRAGLVSSLYANCSSKYCVLRFEFCWLTALSFLSPGAPQWISLVTSLRSNSMVVGIGDLGWSSYEKADFDGDSEASSCSWPKMGTYGHPSQWHARCLPSESPFSHVSCLPLCRSILLLTCIPDLLPTAAHALHSR